MSLHSLSRLACISLLAFAAVSAAGGALAWSAHPAILLNGRASGLQAARVLGDGELMVWVTDLEREGMGKAEWDSRTHSIALVAAGVRIDFQPGNRTARVTLTSSSGGPTERREPLAHPALQSGGRLMVPLSFVCRKLGVTIQRRSRSAVNLIQAKPPLVRASSGSEAVGAVIGKVAFGGRPLPAVLLRLVRDADSTFLPGRRARADARGRYHFAGVPPGRYRVYAYVGDNPDYFNRETAPLTVSGAEVVAPTISMGWVIRPRQPRPGARLPSAERLSFAWTPCPGAASYEFTVDDPDTHEEVVFQVVRRPKAEIPGDALALGRRYQCRVLALTGGGDFLGATPGMGAQPWSITVVAGDDSPSTSVGK